MADDEFAYRLNGAPTSRSDGCGCVDHDIEAVYREEGTADPWVVVPAHHTTITLPAADIATVMAMPDSTGGERTAKNTAYKQLMLDNFGLRVNPFDTDWIVSLMQDFLDANTASATQATAIDDYIQVTLGVSYPIEFQLD